jgi:hypothetical protein
VTIADACHRKPEGISTAERARPGHSNAVFDDEMQRASRGELGHQPAGRQPCAFAVADSGLGLDHMRVELLPVFRSGALNQCETILRDLPKILEQASLGIGGRDLRQLTLPAYRLGHDDPAGLTEPRGHPPVHFHRCHIRVDAGQ